MKVTGIIAEYNPFHNGHLRHLKASRERTGADYVVVAMSGCFVQRGDAAIVHKMQRAEMALAMGADAVFELPVCAATASAAYFAGGGVRLLGSTGVVTHMAFGSEETDLSLLSAIVSVLADGADQLDERIRTELKNGLSYPAARALAVQNVLAQRDPQLAEQAGRAMNSGNTILALEYLLALRAQKSPIVPLALPIPADEQGRRDSASAIRKIVRENTPESAYAVLRDAQLMPQGALELLTSGKRESVFSLSLNDFSDMLYHKLRSMSLPELAAVPDVGDDLAARILNGLPEFTDAESFLSRLSVRSYTRTRLARALVHVLLSVSPYPAGSDPPYLRLIGMRQDAGALIRTIRENASVPLLQRLDAENIKRLSPEGKALLDQDLFASDLYRQVFARKHGITLPRDYENPCVIY